MEVGIQSQSPHPQPLCSTKCPGVAQGKHVMREKSRSLNKGAYETVAVKR